MYGAFPRPAPTLRVTRSPNEQRTFVAIAAAATVFYVAFIARTAFAADGQTYFSLFDDAMISMRYARNLAHGVGLIWNPGEAPVEGYTNFLWTVWMAVLHLLPVSEAKVSLLVMISEALILLVNLHLVRLIALEVSGGSRPVARISVALVALYYPLVYWSLRGMEVGPLCLALSAATYCALKLRQAWSAGRLLALAACLAPLPLIRPDGILPAMVIAAFAAVTAQEGRRAFTAGVAAAAVLGPVMLHTLFRVAYYGDALPNTYYLKMEGVPVRDRLLRGAGAFKDVSLVHLWPAFVLSAVNWRRLADPGLGLLLAVAVCQCGYSVYVGGDAWEWMRYANRYIAVAMPALIVLCAAGVARLAALPPRQLRRLMIGVGLGGGSILLAQGIAVLLGRGRLPSFFGRYPVFGDAVGWGGTVVGAAMLVAASVGAVSREAWGRGPAGERKASPRAARRLSALAAAALFLALSGPGLAHWMITGGVHVADDAVMTRIGLRIRRLTSEDASIAVVWAGAIPYFAHRRAIDLVGKNDRVIARERGRGAFYPGHNKWDYRYSIGRKRPDLIVQLHDPTEADIRYIASLGYEPVGGGMYVRRDGRAVDRSRAAELVAPADR